MKNHPKCPFKNQYMNTPCNSVMLKNHHEWWCLKHGTTNFTREPWDKVETPVETYEAENGRLAWSQDDISKLIELDEQGFTLEQCAVKLGRTRSSVYNRLWMIKGKG